MHLMLQAIILFGVSAPGKADQGMKRFYRIGHSYQVVFKVDICVQQVNSLYLLTPMLDKENAKLLEDEILLERLHNLYGDNTTTEAKKKIS
ncbi:hypothetical protein [Pedobacter sp. L105]|uniref:hypothetical protein n=1 Tax=Pedobacter sp. L105 TaxID=1641871 RepID=UPI00131DE376|nr:hypothetical protein [Pedobacter sp. L105]